MSKKNVLIITLILLSTSINADTLQRLSAIATGGVPWDIMPRNIYGYLADRSNLVALDISDSLNPFILCKSGGAIPCGAGVYIKDTLVYVYEDVGCAFWIANISSPDTIIFLSWYELPNTSVFPQPWGIEVVDTILFVADGNDGLFIFNVKDPTNPTQITFYDTPYNLTDFFILDTLIYLADCGSIIILNIKNPASPFHVGAIDIPTYCTDVHVVYPYAYASAYASFGVGTDGSIKIIDVSDPTNPTIIGSINNIRGDPRAVFVNDDYIYCAAMDWWADKENKGKTRADVEGGIRVAQGTTPDSLIISYDTPGDPREIFVRGNLLLVPDNDSLQILYHNNTGVEEHNNKAIPLISKFLVFPNPSRNKVTCEFQFQKASRIVVSIYDELGRKVREIYCGPMIPGNVHFYWDGKDDNKNLMPLGEYFLQISTLDGSFSESKKVVYLGDK